MNKILVSLLLIFMASTALFAQDTITIYYNKNWLEIPDKKDAVFYRKAFPDSNHVWTANDFYTSNKIQMTGTYKSKRLDVKHGHFIYYFENGNKSSEGDYVDDKSEGIWTTWYENGQKKSEGAYNDDLADGIWHYWYETGEKKSEGTCINDKKMGVWNYWYESGELESTETYSRAGNCTYEEFHENGVMRCKGTVVNNQVDGLWTYWNSDGRVFLKGNFRDGLKNGEWVRPFREGEMKLYFKDGVLQGKQLGGIDRSQ